MACEVQIFCSKWHKYLKIKGTLDKYNIIPQLFKMGCHTIISVPGGFTLHMTGYAPACTKSIEKGSFLDIRRRRRLLQKGYIFRC